MGEHQLDKLGVTGSSPVPPTPESPAQAGFSFSRTETHPRSCPQNVRKGHGVTARRHAKNLESMVRQMSRRLVWIAIGILVIVVIVFVVLINFLEFVSEQN